MKLKRFISILVCLLFCFGSFNTCIFAMTGENNKAGGEGSSERSYILIDSSTGEVLAEKNADETQSVASITKIMTMLLLAEAVESGEAPLESVVTISDDVFKTYGSKAWLDPKKDVLTVDEILQTIALISANDSCVVVADTLSGSEESFVEKMNKKAKELGMENTEFFNSSGLDDNNDGHSSARDVAIMARELLEKHPWITNYTSRYNGAIRNGTYPLTNTNILVHENLGYQGCNGLKTGTTDKAGHCLCGSAKKDGMQLIAVVLGCSKAQDRFEKCKELFNYGFANYKMLELKGDDMDFENIKVVRGQKEDVPVEAGEENVKVLVKKGGAKPEAVVEMQKEVKAPIEKGQEVGRIKFTIGEEKVGEQKIVAATGVEKMKFGFVFGRCFKSLLGIEAS